MSSEWGWGSSQQRVRLAPWPRAWPLPDKQVSEGRTGPALGQRCSGGKTQPVPPSGRALAQCPLALSSQVASCASEELQSFREAARSAHGPEPSGLGDPGSQPPAALPPPPPPAAPAPPPASRTAPRASASALGTPVDARQALMDAIRSGTGAARLRKVMRAACEPGRGGEGTWRDVPPAGGRPGLGQQQDEGGGVGGLRPAPPCPAGPCTPSRERWSARLASGDAGEGASATNP